MGTNAKLAIPLYVGDPASHQGATFATDMGADELLDAVPSTPARIESVDPGDTWFAEKFGLPGEEDPEPIPVGFAGLVKTNLTQDDQTGIGARCRFRAWDLVNYGDADEPIAPTSESSNTFTVGDYTDCDDSPFGAIGSDYAEAHGVGPFEITLDFETPVGKTYEDGDDFGQLFVLSVFETHGPITAVYKLYESGVLRGTLTAIDGKNPRGTSGTDRLKLIPFDAALLQTNGRVELKVEVTGFGAASRYRIHGARLCPNFDPTAPAIVDSGWFMALPDITDDAFGDLPASWVGNLPSRNVFYWPDTIAEDAVYWRFDIRDPFNRDGFIDIGEAGAGPRVEATINRDLGKLLDLKPLGQRTITAGGKHVGVAGDWIRTIFLPLSWMSPEEAAALLERVLRMSTLAPVAIQLVDTDNEKRLLSCYGSIGAAPEYAAPYALIRGTTIVVDEEL